MTSNYMTPQKISHYTELFAHYDYYNRGAIHFLNVAQILQSMQIKLRKEQVISLIRETGNDDPSTVKLDEFLAIISTIIEDKWMNEQIDAAFKIFDVDKSQEIDENDLKKGFSEMGLNLAAGEIQEMMKLVNGEKISKELFKMYILDV